VKRITFFSCCCWLVANNAKWSAQSLNLLSLYEFLRIFLNFAQFVKISDFLLR